MTGAKTLVDKIWDLHVVADLGQGQSLLHVDRHLLHDLSGTMALEDIAEKGYAVHTPELAFATPDHAVSSQPGRDDDTGGRSGRFVRGLRAGCSKWGIELFDLNDAGQGIVHVIGPEQGITLPGTTLVCGDSHTSTHGALGALAWGIGSSEVTHVLATQTVIQTKPKQMRIKFDGALGPGVEAKDLILYVVGKFGAGAGSGFAVEYAGPAIRALGVDARATLCNMSIELGARMGIIAPDDVTFDYLSGKPYAPKGAMWDRAVDHWRGLTTGGDAVFDAELSVNAGEIEPQITWGTSPQHVIAVGGRVPDPAEIADAGTRQSVAAALDYIGLMPGQPIEGVSIDRVFIGSCTNSRLCDLQAAARVASGRKVADHVTAWVVPGSQQVKKAAEAEGLDRVFRDAGFEWREPSCSMCVAANGERVDPKARCVSTSNRNFVGRQGPDARTHLTNPAMAAAAAVAGHITDVRKLMA
ncbi:MAG: 3-isopropylmalate dehydratase large subunit [Rhodospirillales bacterium]|nr:3-isopropylmalate dehydratase large subunit [Rhodospirillales bacterium]